MSGANEGDDLSLCAMQSTTTTAKRKILLVEDLPLLASATADILRIECPYHDVDIAYTVSDVLTLPLDTYDRLFVDLSIPGAQSLSLVHTLAEAGHAARVCVVTQVNTAAIISGARSLGVLAFIGKWESVAEFRRKINLVMRGVPTFPIAEPALPSAMPHLSAREHAVLQLLQSGYDTKTSAHRLAISEITLKRTVSDLKLRFNARTRAQVVAAAIECGLLSSAPVYNVTSIHKSL